MSDVSGATTSASSTNAGSNTSGANANEVPNPQGSESKPQTGEAATKAQKEKLKLLVDGQEIEDEIDWSDREAIKRDRQIAHAAKKRFAEAAEAKKKAFELAKKFEASEDEFLSRLDPAKARALAEKFLLAQIKEEMLSPKEREDRDRKAQEEKEINELRKFKSEHEAQKAAAMESEIAQNFQATIIDALKLTGMPPTPEGVKRMAALKLKNIELGLELTPQELAKEYKAEETRKLKALIGSADAAQLLEMFGPDIANKIRKHDLKGILEKQNQFTQKPQVTSQSRGDAPTKDYETTEEWRERINRNLKK